MKRALPILILALLGSLIAIAPLQLPRQSTVGELKDGTALVPTGQLLVRGSAMAVLDIPGRPVDLALSPDRKTLAALNVSGIDFIDVAKWSVLRSVPISATSYLGLAFSPDGRFVFAGALAKGAQKQDQLLRIPLSGGEPLRAFTLPDNSVPAGVAVSARFAYVCLNRRNVVAQVDLETGVIARTVATGAAPLSIAILPPGKKAYVSNWGGKMPEPRNTVADSAGTPVRVDGRGIASSGSVSVIDLENMTVQSTIEVGLHPSGMALRADGRLLAVANANSDSVSLIDPLADRVVDTLHLAPLPSGAFGSSPTAVAFGPNGRLFVATGTNNAVAVTGQEKGRYRVSGWLPAGWYPVAVVPLDERSILVANTKGTGSRDRKGEEYYSVFGYLGSLLKLSVPPVIELKRLTAAAAGANKPLLAPPDGEVRDLSRLGIRHVFFIIKENRTYDQVFGDLGRGNGEPRLAIYGKNVTPNHAALALRYAVLDNFYASGAVSADGHQWLTQAFVVDYLERAFSKWPRSYPYAGGDPLAYAGSGFLWDNAIRHGKTVRIYGEYADPRNTRVRQTWADFYKDLSNDPPQIKVEARSSIESMNKFMDPGFPPFHMSIPDQWRFREFMREFREFESGNNLPNLLIFLFSSDHTNGTRPGTPTPRAMVADNDLALGKMVEAISHSKFWAESVILITEDDAQNGLDHVDGHRTVALLAGPNVRRRFVDSTMYNHINMVRTIEEILGLPPMNKFDAAAYAMRPLFTAKPDLTRYDAQKNLIPLDELNPPLRALKGPALQAARDSLRMNFEEPDDVPEDRLNRILWHQERGWNVPYPGTRHATGIK